MKRKMNNISIMQLQMVLLGFVFRCGKCQNFWKTEFFSTNTPTFKQSFPNHDSFKELADCVCRAKHELVWGISQSGVDVMWCELLWQLHVSLQRCQPFLTDSFSCQPSHLKKSVWLHFTQLEWKTLTDTTLYIPWCLMTPPPPGRSHYTSRWQVTPRSSNLFKDIKMFWGQKVVTLEASSLFMMEPDRFDTTSSVVCSLTTKT